MSVEQPQLSKYGYSRTLDISYEEAIKKTTAALQNEGFGVLCEIDIKQKLKEKLGVDFGSYMILGACNPPLAYQTLQEELDIGLLLPCNLVVYEKDDRTVVSVIDAAKMLSVVNNPKLESVAKKVNEKLRRVLDSL